MQIIAEKILTEELFSSEYEYGFADLKNLLSEEYRSFQYGIAIIKKLDDKIIDDILEGPTPDYFNYYKKINNELNDKIEIICKRLIINGINCMGIKSTVDDNELDEDYYKTLRLKISHKMLGTQSGLGWIGKTDLFISKKYGPRVRMASILLETKVQPSYKPITKSLCGNCSICVDSCPAHAANGKLWNINVDRDDFFDPFKCRENCRKLSKRNINEDVSLCGICINVCPKGRRNIS